MKSKTLWLVGLAAVWCVTVTAALAESGKNAAVDDRTASCAREAKGLKGEEHHRFVNDCLKAANGNGHAVHGQQNKMKYCNTEAGRKALRGDERRAFMSSCLKG